MIIEKEIRLAASPDRVHARGQLHAAVEALEPPVRAVQLTEGQDRGSAGRAKQRQTFALEPDGDRTLARIHTEISISGRFATFGQRVIGSQADSFADEV